MSTLKKILALTLAIAMVLSLNVFAAFKDQDKINEDCVSAMEMMNTLGIMLGDENNNANPAKTITRAEAAAMIFRLMNKGNADASMYNGMKVFTDVPAGIWYEGYVNYCYTMGIVQGRTATTFDPSAPVTGYEIAKMLLTCLKYNAEKQGYTGANWAKNVQNDAFAANLLEDYGMGLALPAQRQWVAVMFNQSLNCFVAKYYLGELVVDEEDNNTLGYRNFGLETVKGTLTAIQKAAVEGSVASMNYSTLKTGTGDKAVYTEYKFVADKNLLGQQVKVTYNAKTGKTYGITATGKSQLGVAKLDEVTKSGTGDATKYTVGTVSATAPGATKVFYPNASRVYAAAGAFSTYYGQNSNAPVRAVDTDDDGVFDYIMIDFSQYGEITISAKGVVKFKTNSLTADEAKEQVNYVNTVETEDFVKVTANPFTSKYDVEALELNTAVVTRVYSATKYAIGGTTYWISDDATVSTDALKASAKVDFYVDGSYIVNAAAASETVTATLPENMAMLVATGKTENAYNDMTYYVKLLTLDGKVTEYVYSQASTSHLYVPSEANIEADKDVYVENTVYQYVIDSDDNTVSLKAFSNSKVTNSGISKDADDVKIVAKKSLGGKLVSADAKLFVKYTDDGKTKYAIKTIADFASQSATTAQVFTAKVNGITTVIGGGLIFGTAPEDNTTTVSKYVITLGSSYVEYDGSEYFYEKVKVMYTDGTEEVLVLQKTKSDIATDYVKAYGSDKIFKLNSVSSTGIAALSAEQFKTETSTGMQNVTGVSGNYVQIANLETLESDCVVIVKITDADGDTSFSVKTSLADLYANFSATNTDKTYSELKAAVLTKVGGSGADKDNVTMLYVSAVER